MCVCVSRLRFSLFFFFNIENRVFFSSKRGGEKRFFSFVLEFRYTVSGYLILNSCYRGHEPTVLKHICKGSAGRQHA